MDEVRFTLNERTVTERSAAPTTTLLEYLRRHRDLVGTKEGCAEGDCGACTVAIIDENAPGGPSYRAINSCLVLLPLVHGKRVVTVEGLKKAGAHHPAQEALVRELGSQCGYCTPGVVMSLFEACYREDLNAEWKLDDQLCGNLCRCTGYRPIRDAARQIAGTRPQDEFRAALGDAAAPPDSLDYRSGSQRFSQPTQLSELYDVLEAEPDARIICGATDLGLDVTKRGTRFPVLISVGSIPELRVLEHSSEGWRIGATTLLSDLEDATDQALPPVARMLRFFGSRQIKNRATVGGNLCNASPIGDLAPVFISLGATFVLLSRAGERRIDAEDFFVGYRQTVLTPGEILGYVEIPEVPDTSRIGAYKVSKRREMDISATAAGMRVDLDDAGTVTAARLAYGGMAATPKRASQTEAALVGKPWTEASVMAAAGCLAADFQPLSDHRGSAWFRAELAKNLLIGFYWETTENSAVRLPDRPGGTVVLETQPQARGSNA